MDSTSYIQGDATSNLTPLILVHAISGMALPYMSLESLTSSARQSKRGKRPVYGISTPLYSRSRSHHSQPLPKSLTKLANLYVDLVRDEIQAEGPYLLGGWSMGGMIAMEMARVLRRQGETVEHVIMIDSINPDTIPAFEDHQEHADIATNTYNRIAQRMKWPEAASVIEYADGGSGVHTPSSTTSQSTTTASIVSDNGDNDKTLSYNTDLVVRMQQHIFNGLGMLSSYSSSSTLSRPRSCNAISIPLPQQTSATTRPQRTAKPLLRNTSVTLIKCTQLDPSYLPSTMTPHRRNHYLQFAQDDRLGWPAEQFRSFRVLGIDTDHDSCFDPDVIGGLSRILQGILEDIE